MGGGQPFLVVAPLLPLPLPLPLAAAGPVPGAMDHLLDVMCVVNVGSIDLNRGTIGADKGLDLAGRWKASRIAMPTPFCSSGCSLASAGESLP